MSAKGLQTSHSLPGYWIKQSRPGVQLFSGISIRKISLYSEIIPSVHTNIQRALEDDFGNPVKVCEARVRHQ